MFRSFFMAGYECATGHNAHQQRIDQVAATEHDRHMDGDYRRLRGCGIQVAREGVRWPVVDTSRGYHLDSVKRTLELANKHGIQLILDLFHYGYPDEVDIFSSAFVERFRNYCGTIARLVKEETDGPSFFTPVNELSYFAWAGGDAARFRPHASGRSFELKVQLARAAIQGIDEILRVLPSARLVNVDPICRVAAPRDRPELSEDTHNFNEHVVFQGWDMIGGLLFPELGGSRRHLDIIGLNYYWTNQWEHTRPETPLHRNDSRCWPLRDLVRWTWHRYGLDMIISETAHVGRRRASWIREAAAEAEAALNEGIPLKGVCLYPVLGMPEWHDQSTWTRMGLWDLVPGQGGLKRVPHRSSMLALSAAQSRLEGLRMETPVSDLELVRKPYLR